MSVQHTFNVEETDSQYSGPLQNQIVVLRRHDGGLDVIAYFMLNSACSVTGSRVTSAMGKTKLIIQSKTESDAVCSSVRFWQVRFGFDEPEGMITNFELIC